MSTSSGPVRDAAKLARTAGLRDFGTPRLEDVNRRRSQLWILSLAVGLTIPAVVMALAFDLLPAELSELLDLRAVQVGLLALLVALFGYVAEREIALRKLTRMLFEERELTEALVSRVHELDLLFKAARAMNSTLALGPVLDMILDSAYELLRAGGGSISLLAPDRSEELKVAAVRGAATVVLDERTPVAERLGGRGVEAQLVMAEGDGSRGGRPLGSELVVPLQHRDQLVGVLHLTSSPDRPFTEFDLRSVAVFAETAAAAISNARLHESMQATVEALCELDRLKDDFLAMLTHELRSPLTTIIGILSTLDRSVDKLDPDEARELVTMARNQSWRLDRLVDDLLETAGMQHGGPKLRPSEVDARSAVAKAVRPIISQATEHHIEVEAPAQPLIATLDSEALIRVLTNLVGNAVKHTPPGTTITVRVEGWEDGVAVTVTDDGPGIPPGERERIFERFQRGTTSAGTEGLGLGLHIVKTLVEAHGGDIRLVNPAEGGTRFEVRLPALAVEPAPTIPA